MWQWISEMKVEIDGKELQSNFGFFVCVWMVPMLLFLSLELSWGKETEVSRSGISNLKDFEGSDVGVMKKDSNFLGFFQRYFVRKQT